jgi:hypothetical protein
VWRLVFSEDGKALITIRIVVRGNNPPEFPLAGWDLSTGRRLFNRLDDKADYASVFSPDGRLVLCKGISVRDVRTGQERHVFGQKDAHIMDSLWERTAFSLDGRFLAATPIVWMKEGQRSWIERKGVNVWELAANRRVAWLETGPIAQMALAPNGHTLVTFAGDGLRLWDVLSGQVLLHRGDRELYSDLDGRWLACSPDGRTAATGHRDGTALIWNLQPEGLKPSQAITAAERDQLWADLAGADAAKAYAALYRLAARPPEALPFLRAHLRPAAVAAEQLPKLVTALDSPQFKERDAAMQALAALADAAEPELRAALTRQPTAEQRQRIHQLLQRLEGFPSPEVCRRVRAIATLERIGTSEACEVLRRLATGAPGARETREARAALARLQKQPANSP